MLSPLLMTIDDPDPLHAALHAVLDAALGSGADALVLDLGDAAAPGNRAARRGRAAEALADRPAGDGSRCRGGVSIAVRVAPLGSGLVDADLDAVMAGAPDAVWLPGCVGGRDLQHLGAKLAVREAEHGLPAGRTRVVGAPADTAEGVLALGTLPHATPRLLALAWDPGALAGRLGGGAEAAPIAPMRHARDLLLIAAAAAGVAAIDVGLPDDDLAAACRAARRDGFSARVAREAGEIAALARFFGGRRPPAGDEPASIGPFTPDHPGFRALKDEASREGFAFLDRLAGEWASGANRFDRPGERLIGASIDGSLVGVCGLNRDPHVRSASVGRLRHLYVSPAARGRGVGTALVARLLAAASPAFARVRLRTSTASAAAFYEARGFAAAGEGSSTHSIATRSIWSP